MWNLPWRRATRLALTGLACAAVTLASGCYGPDPEGPMVAPTMSFKHYQPIYLDVANIDFVQEYQSPMREPFVEHLLPITPSEAMHQWVKDRIRSVGLNHTMQVIIKDARVVATELPQKEGLKGYFSADPTRRYDARLEVELRIYANGGAMSDASVTVMATQSHTISQKASLQERKQAFARMTVQLMESINAELEKQIFKYFTRYIVYAQTP